MLQLVKDSDTILAVVTSVELLVDELGYSGLYQDIVKIPKGSTWKDAYHAFLCVGGYQLEHEYLRSYLDELPDDIDVANIELEREFKVSIAVTLLDSETLHSIS